MRILKTSAIFFALFLFRTGVDNAYADEYLGSLSAYATLTSDYRFRGVSQSNNEIAEQGALNWNGPSGFYASAWLSRVNFLNGGSLETDFCGGKNSELSETKIDIEGCYYAYPDRNSSFAGSRSGFYETILRLSRDVDQFTITGTVAQSPDFFGRDGFAWYTGGTFGWVLNDWVSITSNIGHQWVNHTLPGYTHWDIGAVGTWHNFTLDARYVDTDFSPGACIAFASGNRGWCSAGAVVQLTYNMNLLP
jgi:uncharacterized protein (TIGR02001 family)